jgi:hypothetical protein
MSKNLLKFTFKIVKQINHVSLFSLFILFSFFLY